MRLCTEKQRGEKKKKNEKGSKKSRGQLICVRM